MYVCSDVRTAYVCMYACMYVCLRVCFYMQYMCNYLNTWARHVAFVLHAACVTYVHGDLDGRRRIRGPGN